MFVCAIRPSGRAHQNQLLVDDGEVDGVATMEEFSTVEIDL